MNCPRVSKDLAQNSGYQAGWLLLVTVFWALCNSCLLLLCRGCCMRLMSVCCGKPKSNQRFGGWFLPIPLPFFHRQRNPGGRIQVKTKCCIILKCDS